MYVNGAWNNGSQLAAVWESTFTFDSVGSSLAQLKDGLDGAFFLASRDATGQLDGFLLADSTGESVSTIQLASQSSDGFIQDATTQIYAEFDNSFSGTDGSLILGHNVIVAAPSSLNFLVNVLSLSRGQLYDQIDRLLDLIFVVGE